MTHAPGKRLAVVALFVLVVGLLAGGIWRYGYGQALNQLEKQATSDLALASDRFTGQLRRYQELAVLMAEHPELAALRRGGDNRAAQALLLDAADKTGALGLLYADPGGRVLARAGDSPDRLTGTPYFERALNGALGQSYGRYGRAGQRAYIYAAPAFGPGEGEVRGVLVVLIDIAELEWDWIGGQPAVFFTDAAGRVFVSNRSELLFWRTGSGGAGLLPRGRARAPAFEADRVAGHELWRMEWGDYLPTRALHLARELPVIGMTGHALLDVAQAQWVAGLQASVFAVICLAFGALLFQAAERRRILARANERLEQRVNERTAELSGANLALRREVSERLEAEAALKQAQSDLVQAGKLSALGQISAGISHELNQPLMAIRQFADNGATFLGKGKADMAGRNLSRISDLAARMARIISNLRAFARHESEPVAKVDLVSVIEQALELTETRLERDRVGVEWHPPAGPVMVQAGEVRLGQVLLNLISNAADAMTESEQKRITITIEPGDPVVAIEVSDTGPGIDEPEKIFDPFYTTKEVGGSEGMGLGLSISYGLVQSFGGEIRGRNAKEGGAVFRVELERWPENEDEDREDAA
ncbi:two-component system C4-dicarboxylate transport sensor histidine kinase DctB [Roseovarius halotolerans]|uniref:C4-dicarboxylate transport sensor protein DctB n=1 Tax=Roseovarius halotolerans TaxID=505353 RepID=A0A1X6ZPK2_9RHOB|nr:ATP-binding protein [Roseovarius halotolerans]RKT28103.1 two-component system C4-dicarboxylate transport sensor histidine kinase DctB [Roseovarius halotolerans]SLN57100.1 C4-dicarboxylate transport sensor protein DctB [Roseovarius halotolerans]